MVSGRCRSDGSRRRRSGWTAFVATLAVVVSAAVFAPAPAHADTVTTGGTNPAAPHISLIGDSTLAGVRWNNTWGTLAAYNYVYDAESCRRTIGDSCRGREGFVPDNDIVTMQRLSGQLGSVLVIMGGYDDGGATFSAGVDAVVAQARSEGVMRVMWLTMRNADVTYVGPTYASNASTYKDNNKILLAKAQQYPDILVLADWATFSATQTDWVYADGVHLTPAGSTAAIDFIKDNLDTLFAAITRWIPGFLAEARLAHPFAGCPATGQLLRSVC